MSETVTSKRPGSEMDPIARATPFSIFCHVLNTSIALLAFCSSVPLAPLLAWGGLSYGIAGYVLYRWVTKKQRSEARMRDPARPPRTHRPVLIGAILAAPWGLLGLWLIGRLPQNQELILIAISVGMSASGSVLLSARPRAAVTYMACILAPVGLRCLLLAGTEYLLLSALTVSFGTFLLICIKGCSELFSEKRRAIQQLGKSLEATEAARRELEFAATHDALTGLPNRRAFLQHPLTTGERTQDGVALFCIDVDRFKPVNDTFGHDVGDELLQQLGQRLLSSVRPGDFVARLGGDEFAIVISGIEDETQAEERAASIYDILAAPYSVAGHQLSVGASIGISLGAADITHVNQLLKRADLALYRAKQKDERRVCCFQRAMLTELKQRQELEDDLRLAVAADQLELYYQPIIEIASGRLVGAEALVRWRHPVRGLVPPADFLPIAEDIRLLHAIENWVVTEACRALANWPPHMIMSVNISPSRIASTELARDLAPIVARMGIRPGQLELEITESTILNNDPDIQRKLAELKALGVSLALDDFGTGYSSLAYLSRFPFDRIKIDRAFVQGLLTSGASSSIVHATTEMARSLGMKTTAEGIETYDQLAKLRSLGVELGQGYLFSKPVPAVELAALFLRETRAAMQETATPRPKLAVV